MMMLKKGLVWSLLVVGAVAVASGYPNPVDGGGAVTVTNSWDAGAQLTVGESSASNALSIIDGGEVVDGKAIVGELSGSDGNSVVVSGSGSSWTNQSELVIGNGGSFNALLIEDGASVYNINGVVGVEEGSVNNTVTVSGTNSVWENESTLIIGHNGAGNSLIITNGGTVNSSYGAIGIASPADGNSVLVGGAGSVWNNTGNLQIGTDINSGNSLTIADGGKVVVGGQLNIYSDDHLNLNDGGWLRIDGHSDLRDPGFHYNAGSTLEVTGSVWFNGGVDDRNTLIFQGAHAEWLGHTNDHRFLTIGGVAGNNTIIISNQAAIVTEGTVLSNEYNRMTVTGPGTRFTATSNLVVGAGSSYNEFLVLNGAAVSVTTGYVGQGSSADRNLISVQGSGSVLISGTDFFVGTAGGASNRFEISDGGSADLSNTYIGFTNSDHNIIIVDGSNSTFAANELYIGEGEQSQYNSFSVMNGAQASSGSSVLGSGSGANDNNVLVTGDNSFWDAGSSLTVGSETSSNNAVIIENGGKVAADAITIATTNVIGNAVNLNEDGWLLVAGDMDAEMDGFNWAARSTLEVQGSIINLNGMHDGMNTLVLSSGGIWSNDVEAAVGYTNASSHLILNDGGMVISSNGYIGVFAGSGSNSVIISGPGSLWSNRNDFVVGLEGAFNTVTISNQGTVFTEFFTVLGAEASADGNSIIINGSKSRLINEDLCIFVGYEGSDNQLLIQNGGIATSVGGYIGTHSDGNSVLIDGTDSEWFNRSTLIVGDMGSSNSFTVSNGGSSTVAGNAYLGYDAGSDGNLLSLSGINSSMIFSTTNSNSSVTLNLHVGHKGSGNELRIQDGAWLYNDIGWLGTDSGADNNLALIEGAGSVWYNRDSFYAGNSGSSNTVVIRNGAYLVDNTGYIGYHADSVSNRVVVDNAEWQNSGGLFVGFNGSANSLEIINGSEVVSGESRIGSEGFANDNRAVVSGAGSVWYIGGSLWVGNDTGTNNTLLVEDGGRIVVDESISVDTGSWLSVSNGGTVTVYGNTIFTPGFNIGAGGTFETFGGVSGLGGVLESGRTLRLAGDGASWNEPGDILLESGATLEIGPGASVSTPSNFVQQTAATLSFDTTTNSSGAPVSGTVSVGQVADFSAGANFYYNLGSLSFDRTYTNLTVSAETLVIGGQTNATTADLEQYLNTGGTLVGVSLIVDDQDILAIINRIGASDALNPVDADLRAVIDEIEARALAGDPLANRQLSIINAMSAEEANRQLEQFYTRGTPNYQHMDGVLQGLKQIEKRTSELLMETMYYIPSGPYGPAAAAGNWRGWASVYGFNGSRDGGGGYAEYDLGTYGTVLGVDRSFGNMILGLSGGLAQSGIDQADGDTSDATTAYGALYASYSLESVDWDLIGSYGSSSIESGSGTVFGSSAETDASTAVFYIGASEEARYGPMTVTPLAAFQTALYSQDGYDEVSANAIGRSVTDYERWSYRSIFGVSMNTVKNLSKFDFTARFKANWEHEFNTDVDTLNYTLIGGTDPHFFTIQAPVEDLIDLGIGVGALFGENLEISIGLDGLFAREFIGASYNGKIQYTF